MEERAYHLQVQAQSAVAAAIDSGILVRQPCEVCGAKGQAHHDSYYPARWLDVRWLCGQHHSEWHSRHTPEWPTIYEFHPSDVPGIGTRKIGRPQRPWFRKAKRKWYVELGGKQIDLGPDKEQAMTRFRQLRLEAAGRNLQSNLQESSLAPALK